MKDSSKHSCGSREKRHLHNSQTADWPRFPAVRPTDDAPPGARAAVSHRSRSGRLPPTAGARSEARDSPSSVTGVPQSSGRDGGGHRENGSGAGPGAGQGGDWVFRPWSVRLQHSPGRSQPSASSCLLSLLAEPMEQPGVPVQS